jgi:hypothetical protein
MRIALMPVAPMRTSSGSIKPSIANVQGKVEEK